MTTSYQQPTMELRFVERLGDAYVPLMSGGVTRIKRLGRVLQQKWIVDTGSRSLSYEENVPNGVLLQRKPDGDGLWAICREEWRDVPLVKEATK